MFMIDASMPIGPGDRLIAERLTRPQAADVVVAVNKVDGASRGEVIEQLAKAGEWDFASYVPVSAIDGTGLDDARRRDRGTAARKGRPTTRRG